VALLAELMRPSGARIESIPYSISFAWSRATPPLDPVVAVMVPESA